MNGANGTRSKMGSGSVQNNLPDGKRGRTTCSFCHDTIILDLNKLGDNLNRQKLAQSLIDHRRLNLDIPKNLSELELPLCAPCKNLSMKFSHLWEQLGDTFHHIVEKIAVGEFITHGRRPTNMSTKNYNDLESKKWAGLKDELWSDHTKTSSQSAGAPGDGEDDYESDSSVEEDSVAILMEDEEELAPRISNVRSVSSGSLVQSSSEEIDQEVFVPEEVKDEQVQQVISNVHLKKRTLVSSSSDVGSKRQRGRPKKGSRTSIVNKLAFGKMNTSFAPTTRGKSEAGAKRVCKCKSCGRAFATPAALMKHRFKCASNR